MAPLPETLHVPVRGAFLASLGKGSGPWSTLAREEGATLLSEFSHPTISHARQRQHLVHCALCSLSALGRHSQAHSTPHRLTLSHSCQINPAKVWPHRTRVNMRVSCGTNSVLVAPSECQYAVSDA